MRTFTEYQLFELRLEIAKLKQYSPSRGYAHLDTDMEESDGMQSAENRYISVADIERFILKLKVASAALALSGESTEEKHKPDWIMSDEQDTLIRALKKFNDMNAFVGATTDTKNFPREIAFLALDAGMSVRLDFWGDEVYINKDESLGYPAVKWSSTGLIQDMTEFVEILNAYDGAAQVGWSIKNMGYKEMISLIF